MKTTATKKELFLRKISKQKGGCWNWTACIDKDGYGMFGMEDGVTLSHRASWRLHFGPIPGEMCVCHKCVNPKHLFLGTPLDNARDRESKFRGRKGRVFGPRLLDEGGMEKVVALRRSGMPLTKIRDEMGLRSVGPVLLTLKVKGF